MSYALQSSQNTLKLAQTLKMQNLTDEVTKRLDMSAAVLKTAVLHTVGCKLTSPPV